MREKEKISVLVVDDEEINLKLLSEMIRACSFACELQTARNGFEALEKAKTFQPDIILLDVMMPGIDGYEVCRRLRADPQTQVTPVVMVTFLTDRDAKLEGLKAGASDFLNKPVDRAELTTRVQNLVKVKAFQDLLQNHNLILEDQVAERTKRLRDAFRRLNEAYRKIKLGMETIYRLTRAAEYRDEGTGAHIRRISDYSMVLAKHLGFSEQKAEALSYASVLHDVGKVGIRDSILLKCGKLLPEEIEIMKSHAMIGADILSESELELLKMAGMIALYHHERWDGTGYPSGLKGADIPIECQIVNIADQYDALRSKRPYKPALDHQTAYQIITEGDGKTMPHHFNPDVLQAFKDCAPKFAEIFENNPNDLEMFRHCARELEEFVESNQELVEVE